MLYYHVVVVVVVCCCCCCCLLLLLLLLVVLLLLTDTYIQTPKCSICKEYCTEERGLQHCSECLVCICGQDCVTTTFKLEGEDGDR